MKRERLRVLLSLFRHVLPLTNGSCHYTMPVVKRYDAHDPLTEITKICRKSFVPQWNMFTLGKFNWGGGGGGGGGCYVIIFLYVQFWIRLAAVNYCGKKVRIVVSPAVRSINKSHDTRNCVQNEPEHAVCVIFTTLLYYKALGLIYVIWYGKYTTITLVLTTAIA